MQLLYKESEPMLRGENVLAAQRALRDNRYGNFRPGRPDGFWGPKSHAATQRAKYAIGYKNQRVTGQYGDALHAFLIEQKPLPAAYRIRRKKRLKMIRERSRDFRPLEQGYPTVLRFAGNTHGAMVPVRIILHDTESHDAAGATDISGVAGFLLRTSDKLGSQFIVDSEGIIGQCGSPAELMYHTGGRNTGSVGIEQIGFARFPIKVWFLRPKQLQSVSRLCAVLCHDHGIPPTASVERGISTHAMQSRAFATTSHTDPGFGYPFKLVVSRAAAMVERGGWFV